MHVHQDQAYTVIMLNHGSRVRLRRRLTAAAAWGAGPFAAALVGMLRGQIAAVLLALDADDLGEARYELRRAVTTVAVAGKYVVPAGRRPDADAIRIYRPAARALADVVEAAATAWDQADDWAQAADRPLTPDRLREVCDVLGRATQVGAAVDRAVCHHMVSALDGLPRV